ncbi:lipoprotein [Sinimarinibacterium sp. NLF-5-8]|uniref:LPS translocon maturation chaperone LptM n=1 Tax=Sinimarinibacterium sp. NLF-5-8 TaxID=2698684 RepID=UPI00345F1E81
MTAQSILRTYFLQAQTVMARYGWIWLACMVLSACGQSGDLYLPDTSPAATPTPALETTPTP